MKDIVNESLVIAIRDGRDRVGWTDVEGEAREAARAPRRSRVHRARASRGRGPRGVPRRGRVPPPQAHDDRPRDDRAPRGRRRVRVVDPAGGPVRAMEDGARDRRDHVPRVARGRATVLRRRPLDRRRRRHAGRDRADHPDARVLRDGRDDRVPFGHPGRPAWSRRPGGDRCGPVPVRLGVRQDDRAQAPGAVRPDAGAPH